MEEDNNFTLRFASHYQMRNGGSEKHFLLMHSRKIHATECTGVELFLTKETGSGTFLKPRRGGVTKVTPQIDWIAHSYAATEKIP